MFWRVFDCFFDICHHLPPLGPVISGAKLNSGSGAGGLSIQLLRSITKDKCDGGECMGYCYGRSSWLRTARDACQCQSRTPVLLFRLPAAPETGTVCAQPKTVKFGNSRVRNSRILGKARKDAGGLAGRRCDCPAPPPRAIAFQNRMTRDSRHHQNVGAEARITVDNRKTLGGSRGQYFAAIYPV